MEVEEEWQYRATVNDSLHLLRINSAKYFQLWLTVLISPVRTSGTIAIVRRENKHQILAFDVWSLAIVWILVFGTWNLF
jgi:hypothetical protein